MSDILEKLTPITAPDLTSSSFGDNVKQQFENIDSNFRKLGNYDFIKGEHGADLGICRESIFIDDTTKLSALGAAVVSVILGKIVNENDDITKIEGAPGKVLDSNWYDFFVKDGVADEDTSMISVFYRDINPLLENSIREYIGSPTPIVFIDARFSSSTIKKAGEDNSYDDYSSVTDLSCALYVSYDNGWRVEKINHFPTLYYEDSMFKWKIADKESGIRAQGAPGLDGRPGRVWIGLTDSVISGNDITSITATDVPISCILSDEGEWVEWSDSAKLDVFEEMGVREGDTIIMIPINDINDVTKSESQYVTDNLIFISSVKIKDGKYVAYYNKYNLLNVSIGDTWVYETLLHVGGTGDKDIRGLFIRMKPDAQKDDKDFGKAHILYADKIDSSGELNNHLHIRPTADFRNLSGVVGLCKLSIEKYNTIHLSNEGSSGAIGVELTNKTLKGENSATLSISSNKGVTSSSSNILMNKGFKLYSNESNLYADIELVDANNSGNYNLTVNRFANFTNRLKVRDSISIYPETSFDQSGSINFQNAEGGGDMSIDYTYNSHSASIGINADLTRVSNNLTVKGNLTVGDGINVTDRIEMFGTSSQPCPYIDFHYGGSDKDYTSRIVEDSEGTLNIPNSLNVDTNFSAFGNSNCPVVMRSDLNNISMENFFNKAWDGDTQDKTITSVIPVGPSAYLETGYFTINSIAANIRCSGFTVPVTFKQTFNVSKGAIVSDAAIEDAQLNLFLRLGNTYKLIATSEDSFTDTQEKFINDEGETISSIPTNKSGYCIHNHTFSFSNINKKIKDLISSNFYKLRLSCSYKTTYGYSGLSSGIVHTDSTSLTLKNAKSIQVSYIEGSGTYSKPMLLLDGSILCLGNSRHRGIGFWMDTRSDKQIADEAKVSVEEYKKRNESAGIFVSYCDNSGAEQYRTFTIADILRKLGS